MFYVNGMGFELHTVEPYSPHLMRSDGSYTLGCTDGDVGVVWLSESLHGAMLDKVLCHELVHCFCIAYNVYMTLETEEICADFVATYGRDVFSVADDIIERYMTYG